MIIRSYNPESDFEKLFELLRSEGDEWSCYSSDQVIEKYAKALRSSITYVAYSEDKLCGYSRSVNDNDFYIYVCDLLVQHGYRGIGIGKLLMECISREFPDQEVYVMSDVDDYYIKLGFEKEGSIFCVDKCVRD